MKVVGHEEQELKLEPTWECVRGNLHKLVQTIIL